MNREVVSRLHSSFENFARSEGGVEFWFARDLQKLLGYTAWRNFMRVVEKAMTSCEGSGYAASDHFVDVNKMIELAKGATRAVEDMALTRYACYLVAQNGDPKKEQIAFAQSYFAVQTRKQELVEERILLDERLAARRKLVESETELSRNIYERGVDEGGFARIRSKGDAALFGGNSTQAMKERLGVPSNRPLADFLPTVTITAKNLATEITNFNVVKDKMAGERTISGEHVRNNRDVRNLLVRRGIVPEELPPEEDLKRLERRVKSQDKALPTDFTKLSPPDGTEE